MRSLPGRGLVTTVGVHPTRCLAITEASEADGGMDGYLSQLQQVRTHRPSMNLTAVVELCQRGGSWLPSDPLHCGPSATSGCGLLCDVTVLLGSGGTICAGTHPHSIFPRANHPFHAFHPCAQLAMCVMTHPSWQWRELLRSWSSPSGSAVWTGIAHVGVLVGTS